MEDKGTKLRKNRLRAIGADSLPGDQEGASGESPQFRPLSQTTDSPKPTSSTLGRVILAIGVVLFGVGLCLAVIGIVDVFIADWDAYGELSDSHIWVTVVGILLSACGAGIATYGHAPKSGVLVVGVVIAVVIVGFSVVGTAFVLSPSVKLTPVLSLSYDNGCLSTNPSVCIAGKVYNDGDVAGYVTISFTIQDSRGWSIAAFHQLGRIDGNGGFASVNLSYDWPYEYDGVYVDHPTQIVPTWTYSLSAGPDYSNPKHDAHWGA